MTSFVLKFKIEVKMNTFKIKTKTKNGILIIYPYGHLDAHHVEKFENEIKKHIKNKYYKILINCKDLNYISSAGMGVIMGYLEEVREKNGDIKLCSLNKTVYEIFDLVGFTEIYDFLDSEEQGLKKFNEL